MTYCHDMNMPMPDVVDLCRKYERALQRIAAGHKASPQYPGGHIYSRECDGCKMQEIAIEALAANPESKP
jgi:hypothetical protein